MSNEEAIDPFDYSDDDGPILFSDNTARSGLKERHLEVYAEAGARPLTAEDAATAIAGVLHLWQRPHEDLHGYTKYVDEVKQWLSARVAAAMDYECGAASEEVVAYNRTNGTIPYPHPKIARGLTQEELDENLDAALKGYWADDAPAAVEEKRPRSLEEILGQ